uniref:ubiquitinyl hydrolase 1 n=1 Tax=Setaria digitata TaxID=48799 RepID=A0A915Q7V4_9BILA
MASRDVLLEAFIDETRASQNIALSFLEGHHWNYEKSLQYYYNWKKKGETGPHVYASNSSDKVNDSDAEENEEYEQTLRWPSYAFVLPNLFEQPADFRNYLEKDLIETSTLKRLENSGHLNWWCWNGSGQRMWPLSTTGDGNCLLHAASLGMWGIHDRQLMLRKILYEMLTRGSRRHILWRRWRWTESQSNLQSGLVLTDEEWQREWDNILHMAAAIPRTFTTSEDDTPDKSDNVEQIYESLESIHVFALAHILKRPIIGAFFVSDTVLRNAVGEELSPIPFGGIYLPLECPSDQCHRSPLVLCYDSAHFSALVTMRHTASNSVQPIIPITDKDRNLLPLHFSVDPGPDFTWWKDSEDAEIAARIELTEADRLSLICEYMDIVKIQVRRYSFRHNLAGAGHMNGVEGRKSMTLSCGDVFVTKDHSARLLSEIAQQIKKRFKIGRKKKNKSVSTEEQVTVSDLRSANVVIAARLHSHAHQYMEHMVDNYLCLAKERFEQLKNTPGTTLRQRARLSHSFSTSSLLVTCINKHCQKSASQSTNFLCNDCFEYQKQLMASFGCSQPGHLRSLRSCLSTTLRSPSDLSPQRYGSIKSNTMPSITVSSVTASHIDKGMKNAWDISGHDLSPASVPVVVGSVAQASQSHFPDSKHCSEHTAASCERIVHTVAVHYTHAPSENITAKVASVEGANGVTHYYISQQTDSG